MEAGGIKGVDATGRAERHDNGEAVVDELPVNLLSLPAYEAAAHVAAADPLRHAAHNKNEG